MGRRLTKLHIYIQRERPTIVGIRRARFRRLHRLNDVVHYRNHRHSIGVVRLHMLVFVAVYALSIRNNSRDTTARLESSSAAIRLHLSRSSGSHDG